MVNANFRFINYLCIKNIELNFEMDTPWVFFNGVNGSGKSTILKAIARSLSSKYDCNFYDNGIGNNITEDNEATTLYSKNKDFSDCNAESYHSSRNDVTSGGQELEYIPNIISYGSEWCSVVSFSSSHRHRNSETLYTNNSFLHNIEDDVLSRWHYISKRKKDHKLCIDFFKKIIPNLKDIIVDKNDHIFYKIGYESTCKTNLLTYFQLPTSSQNLISKFGDMFIYLKKHGFESKKTFVILDDIDLYLDETNQIGLTNELTNFFPNITFIATTNSDKLIETSPVGSKEFKIRNDYNQGIIIKN